MVVKSLSRVRLFATPWTLALQGPLSMGCPREDSWSGLLFPSPGDLPHPGIQPTSPDLAGGIFFSPRSRGNPKECDGEELRVWKQRDWDGGGGR